VDLQLFWALMIESVHVEVLVTKGDLDISVFSAQGELRFWREGHPEQPAMREDLIGYYAVGGDARIDLGDLEHVEIRERPDLDHVDVQLAAGVTLVLGEQE
jgi:hypothetical protein